MERLDQLYSKLVLTRPPFEIGTSTSKSCMSYLVHVWEGTLQYHPTYAKGNSSTREGIHATSSQSIQAESVWHLPTCRIEKGTSLLRGTSGCATGQGAMAFWFPKNWCYPPPTKNNRRSLGAWLSKHIWGFQKSSCQLAGQVSMVTFVWFLWDAAHVLMWFFVPVQKYWTFNGVTGFTDMSIWLG